MTSVTSPLYACCISGAIGSGKTTIVSKLCEYLNAKYPGKTHIIREYIDGRMRRTSGELLSEYLQGRISDTTFQSYIQSYYLHELQNPEINNKIVLMERCMSDSVAIFCNNANRKYGTWIPGHKNLEDLDFTVMYNNCIKVDSISGFPNYFIKNFEFSRVETRSVEETVDTVKEIIENDLKNGVHNRVIGLYSSGEECYKRMVSRSRNGESAYTREDIETNCHAYEQLYKLIEDPSYSEIRVFDLGILFHDTK